MTNRERFLAVLNFEKPDDRLPVKIGRAHV